MSELTKDARVNLINRRTTAWLLEAALLSVTVSPPALLLYLKANPSALASVQAGETAPVWLVSFAVLAAYVLVRDLAGRGSWGKRLVGLAVAPAAGEGSVSAGARVLRNVPIAIPLVPIVEFFAAYKGNDAMQRFGDRLAGTRVVSTDPRRDSGGFGGPLLVAFFVVGGLQTWLTPPLVELWADLLF